MMQNPESSAAQTKPDSPQVHTRRRPAAIGLALFAAFALLAVAADFLAPYDYREQSRQTPNAPPDVWRWRDSSGNWHLRPFIYPARMVDPLQRRYEEDPTHRRPIAFFVTGYRYRLLGLIPLDAHLFGVEGNPSTGRLHLLGTDAVGRDRFSRLLIGSRFSLLLAPMATLLAGALGLLVGALSGYGPRWLDTILMRGADLLLALPTLVLVLAARAAFPLELPPQSAALLLLGCFVALGWAEMARLVRGLVRDLRSRDFILAAVSLGMTPWRILRRHMLPHAAPAIAAQLCLMLAAFLLAETALSFLGVGLQEPEASWGTMLAAAADLNELERPSSWTLLAPAAAITLLVFAARLVAREYEERTRNTRK